MTSDIEMDTVLAGIPKGVYIFEINGPFFFGAAEKFIETIRDLRESPQVLILRMRHVLTIDATGIKTIEDIHVKMQKQGTLFLIAEISSQPLIALERSGLLDKIGENNITGSLELALESARERVQSLNS
jgi:SulP family sulfate permease